MMGEGLPSAKGSDTSVAAAQSMESQAASLRAQILDLLRKNPDGLTTDEIEVITGLSHQTASPRMWELHKRSLIGDSGKRRKTRSGRMATVYRALSAQELADLTERTAASTQKVIKETKAAATKLTAFEELQQALGVKKGDPQ
jgi:predicted transcriptional regulator